MAERLLEAPRRLLSDDRPIQRQGLALVLVFAFPGLATWLPKAIGW